MIADEEIKHPSRYNKNGIEVWDVERAFANPSIDPFIEHLRFGAIEYLLRCWDKNGATDLRKAVVLIEKALSTMSEESKTPEVMQ